jgi:hypothetical protein
VSRESEAVVRAYQPGDEVAIQEAFTEVFGVSRRLADWRWKFEQPPRGSRIVLAFDPDGRLACQYAAIVLDLEVGGARGGEQRLAGQIVDVLSRSRGALGRRGGPFLRTVREFLDRERAAGELAFIYGFPGTRHQRLGELGGLYNRTAAIAKLELDLAGARPVTRRAGAAGRLLEGFDATALDRLWQSARPRYRLAVARNARWFAWRYAARPQGEYEQFGVVRDGRARAWAVLAGHVDAPAGRGTARWVDLVWDGGERADLELLAGEARRRAEARGAERLELWLHGDGPAREALVGAGFAPGEDAERRLSVIVFDARLDLERILGELYLTLGDSDHV